MKKALMIASVLLVAVVSTACINNIAVQELNNKAAEYMQKGDYESAMNRLQASLDLDATMFQTYYNLGIAAINANKFDKAVEALENGIKINPDFSDFYYSLGVAQIGLADELITPKEENPDAEIELNKVDSIEAASKEDIAKAIELKKSSIENFEKYLSMVAEPENKTEIEEMVKQSEEFIEEHSNKGDNKE